MKLSDYDQALLAQIGHFADTWLVEQVRAVMVARNNAEARQPQPAKTFCVTCGNLHATKDHEQCAANEARGLHADGVDPTKCDHGRTGPHYLPLDYKPITGGCPGPGTGASGGEAS